MRKSPDSWKQKVHPALLEVAGMYRTLMVLCKIDPQLVGAEARRFKSQVSEKRAELLSSYSELHPGSSWNHVIAPSVRFLSQVNVVAGTLEWLCWRRFGRPLFVLLAEDDAGNPQAHKKVNRIRDEFWRSLHGQARVARFKGNPVHADLMELGLGLGLDRLTAEELADCFNEICGCRRDHDADALKKFRARVRRKLETAYYRSLREVPPRERFAVHGSDGISAKPYNWPARGIRYVEISSHGQRPECFVYGDGSLLAVTTSRFYNSDALRFLPAAFGLETTQQLFIMFFQDIAA